MNAVNPPQANSQDSPTWSYERTSNDEWENSEFNSLDAQLDCNTAYISSQRHTGLRLVGHFSDGGCSGGTLDRPGLQALIRAIEEGKCKCVVCYKIDRLTRSISDFAKLIEFFEKHGVMFVSVTQQFNTTSAMGRLTLNILLSFSQFERELAGERIRDKVAATKRRGRYTGGPPVLGFDVDHEKTELVVNKAEAKMVRRIFTDFIRNGSPTRMAQQLNAEGMTTKAYLTKKGTHHPGHPWNAMDIYRVLQNRVYLGQVVHKEAVYPGVHPALVTQEVWDQAHAILATNTRVRANHTRSQTPALLKGIIRCGHCDASMGVTFANKSGRKYRYYLCLKAKKNGYGVCPVKSVAAGTVEEAVVNQLRAIFRSFELATTTYRSARTLAQKQGWVVDAVFRESEVINALASIDPIWDALNPDEQARIVKLLVESVTVREDGLDIALRVDGLHSLIAEVNTLVEESDHE